MLQRIRLGGYSPVKVLLLVLLLLNAISFSLLDSVTSALDAWLWLLLLLLYVAEQQGLITASAATVRLVRVLLAMGIAWVWGRYVFEQDWFDVWQTVLWVVLIVLLELESHWPKVLSRYQRSYWVATSGVFVGLSAMVLVFLNQAAWLDAYDALLWLVVFFVIEVDIFNKAQHRVG